MTPLAVEMLFGQQQEGALAVRSLFTDHSVKMDRDLSLLFPNQFKKLPVYLFIPTIAFTRTGFIFNSRVLKNQQRG